MAITKAGPVSGAGVPGIHLASAHGAFASACLTASDKSQGVSGQTAEILARITELLEAVGSHKRHLVMAQVWLLRIDDIEAFSAAWNDWIGDGPAPALSVVEAAASRRDSLVEIRAYAVRDDGADD